MTRRSDIFAAIAAAVVGAAACSGPHGAAMGTARDARCGAEIAGARCHDVRVPEDRAKPDGRSLALRVVVLPAEGAGRVDDAVVYLAGGPGQAVSQLIPAFATTSLRQRRDLVFADQRGTGGSGDLRCAFYTSSGGLLDDFIPLARVRECRARLEQSADLAQYTTAASVEDLEAIRAALGYETMNLVGSSYGTRLALEYLRRYESRVRTLTLEGVVPPGANIPERFGVMAQAALDGVLDECLADADCGARFPELKEETAAVFDRLERGTVTARVTPPGSAPRHVRLSRDHVAEAIRYMLYSSREASVVPSALHAAYQGDFTRIADFLYRWRKDGTFDALYLSVTCAEDVPFVEREAADRDDRTFLGGYRVRQQRAACEEWTRGTVPASHGRPVESGAPALLISGMLDPVTPPAGGDEVARTLPNSVHLRIPSGGHTLSGLRGVECVDRIKEAFIDRGSAAGLDVACVAGIRRSRFDP